ncbi:MULTISPECIES: hypothetical protein [unclassified Burkholderia]|uniref:hypothetical protein n=1 Tax=unclassified Burkholderia TaxID=2613784 RepID=UPI00141EFB7D|nr:MULTISPECIES: hypothetical protein [unclassified Burkholderia]NIE82535.1 hypothetical protein [Burkholderia sp. Tr-860]NIF61312.1 hypothetical protein [Burkholderia sp. Cy-647]NIF94517.1 hypothetical protein [Burkholderia sp. Ax-1720]
MFFRSKPRPPFQSPVLVVDALGFTHKILESDEEALSALADNMDRNYLRFRMTIPFGLVVHAMNKVWGTRDFSTFRLNDMFVVYSSIPKDDFALRYLITASLVFQALLLDGFIPRGGLGWGLVQARPNSLIGTGFIDAYAAAERRSEATRDVCALQLSANFMAHAPASEHVMRLLCFYRGEFFVNPIALTDPQLGHFDRLRMLDLLAAAGINERKLAATSEFLDGFEDFDAADKPESQSRKWREAQIAKASSRSL